MTFLEYLRVKKGLDTDSMDFNDLMDEYYEEYVEYLQGVKDGCGPKQ